MKSPPRHLSRQGLEQLFRVLQDDGFELIGPRLGEGAIDYRTIDGVSDLPEGWTERQAPGKYRLERRSDRALFGFASTAQSFKRFFHPPVEPLFSVRHSKTGPTLQSAATPERKLALIGARSCDLHALGVLDRVLTEGPHPDARYARRRDPVFVVAVQCQSPGGTCFCASMDTGPRAEAGFDLALTELDPKRSLDLLVEVGTERGAKMLERVPSRSASDAEVKLGRELVEQAASKMGRTLDTRSVRELLQENPTHPAWDEVAERCLACSNCTSVCPTCFCTTTEDTLTLEGDAERTQVWDSCYTLDFSYLHGGSVRGSVKARYRQWLTHKFSTWFDQFGSSGCVGCGRCITWCPVGIDVTEQVDALRLAPEIFAPSNSKGTTQ